MKNLLSYFAALLLFVVLICSSCAQSTTDKPTPDAAKRILKLRGYEFNDKAFFAATEANDVASINGFLAAGINPNVKNEENGATALIMAATRDRQPAVEALLKGGADVNAADNAGYTAILRALQGGHNNIADLLLAQPQLNVNVRGINGPPLLTSYVFRDDEKLIKDLVERGADPKLTDPDGDTALHAAAQHGVSKIIELLLSAGADPNAKNKLGGTPLMWAGVFGHEEAARLLLAKGADPGLKDNDGMTAAAWATKNKREAVAELLRNAEKKH